MTNRDPGLFGILAALLLSSCGGGAGPATRQPRARPAASRPAPVSSQAASGPTPASPLQAASGPTPASPVQAASGPTPVSPLQAASGPARWDLARELAADLTGDAEPDVVVPGIRDGKVLVGIVGGPVRATSKAWVLAFGVGERAQDSLCSADARLTLESPALPLAEWGCDERATTERCRSARAANAWLDAHPAVRGVRLDDHECDAFHVYWSAPAGKFLWWRR